MPETKTKTVNVEIIETLRKVVTVEIPSDYSGDDEIAVALAVAMKMYRYEEVVLSGDDHYGTKFNVVKE